MTCNPPGGSPSGTSSCEAGFVSAGLSTQRPGGSGFPKGTKVHEGAVTVTGSHGWPSAHGAHVSVDHTGLACP